MTATSSLFLTQLRRSLLFSGLDRYAGLAIGLASTALIARLLSPDEIGVFAVASAIVVVTNSLREFGTVTYIVQERDLVPDGVRTTVTLVIASSLLTALALAFAAAPLARLYAEPRLEPVIHISSVGLVAGSLAGPTLGLMQREMDFRSVAIINFASTVINLVASLFFIALGFGYLSLPLAAFASAATISVLALSMRRQFWMYKPCLRQWRKVLSFGGYSSATAFLNASFEMLPQLLLGRFAGFNAVGLYSRAAVLAQMPNRAIVGAFQPVILPAFAAKARAGEELKTAYLHGLCLLSCVQWPAFLCLALLAGPVVRLLLGEQWDAAAPVLRMLALASLVMAPAPLTYPVLVASGHIRDTLTSSVISLPISACIVTAAALHGAGTVAASMLIILPLQVGVAMALIRRRLDLSWNEIAASVRRSAAVTLLTASVPATCLAVGGPWADLQSSLLFLAVVGSMLAWLAGLCLTAHPLLAELRIAAEGFHRLVQLNTTRSPSG
ncbi:oligosaccharide flippase family protein [Microvirga massiliensis]|uniref:oligosaccharide flippase family protein n=1 Tax=Microvirga massiliensis TaxID=1033741 RepID=UPI000660C563|nr:oligosaccharide flippase family protein [Microvirga massiliensis]